MASTARAQRRHPDRHVTAPARAAVFATISTGTVSAEFAHSWASLMRADRQSDGDRFGDDGGMIWLRSGPRIAEARTRVVQAFLAHHDAPWLVMVDADMVFRPADVYRLLDAADPDLRPIVGGLCFGGHGPDTMFPTIYVCSRDDQGALDITKVRDYPKDQLVACHATGAAFLAVHRSVLERMLAMFDRMPNGTVNPYPWFAEGHVDRDGHPIGEDITFCLRAGALDVPIHVHTGVKVGHVKDIVLTEELFRP